MSAWNKVLGEIKNEKEGAYHVGILVLVDDAGVLKLDVEVLIDGVEDASDGEIVLQLHRHLFAHQLLEVREEKLQK